MLHIVFLILKIIGIIVGLIVLLLLFFLFVPIRYKGSLDYFEKGNGWVKIYWLLHIVSVKLTIEQNHPQLAIKILGIPLGSRKRKKEEDQFDFETGTEFSQSQAEPAKLPETVKEEVEIQHTEETNSEIEQSSQKDEAELFDEQEETNEQVEPETISFWKKGIQKVQIIWRRISSIPSKLKAVWENFKATVLAIGKKLTSSKQKLTEIKEILLEENSRMVYGFLKVRLLRIVQHIRPKKFQLYLHYGFEDPALTGEVTGVMAMFLGWYENAISLEPDFQQSVLEGSLKFRGRVRIAVLLWEGIRVVFHKSFRVMIKKLMGKIKE